MNEDSKKFLEAAAQEEELETQGDDTTIDENGHTSHGVKVVDISNEVRTSFLSYAMSVIVARAIPDVKDGLKPVHRRIIYAMNELGFTHAKPHKKSARIVGDVMAKYHPHGDTAIYDSMVRLAQDFASRYPTIDSHGNFGSIDGDPAAAMRYTEARMAKIAEEMVRDIEKDTVDMIPNYDGEEQEPVVLPSRIPNVLINGTSGIAVGMATNIPPHNLSETIDAALAVMENPNIDVNELMTNYIYGPDFPTGAYILGKSGIRKAFETGNGSITIRSKCDIEEMDNGKKRIIVTEIPYQVNKAVMIEKIADLVKNKIIEGITDLRDESNREGIRVVIELRKDVVAEVILNQLFKLSQLQVTYSINLLVLVNGEPKVLPVKDILVEYIKHQEDVIRRRTRFDLKKCLDRQHILLGLQIAGKNIDEVIEIIKTSKNGEDAGNRLKERFPLSDIQIKAILDMKLQRLTGIEQEKIDAQLYELEQEITELNRILDDYSHLQEILKQELLDIKNRYGDARKTEITSDSSVIDDEDLIPQENIVISLTTNGYIKRVTSDTYKAQHRGGKGIKGMSTNENDVVDKLLACSTHTDILFFTSFGKVYRLRGYQVPEYSRTAKGIPVLNLIQIEKGEKVRAMLSVYNYDDDHYLNFVTKEGIIKRVQVSQFENIRQNGKIAINLREDDELIDVKYTVGNDEILIANSNGKVVRFDENTVRQMGRTATGVKGIDVDGGHVVGVSTSQEGKYILAISEHGYGKMSVIEDYRKTNRGTKGVKTVNTTEKTGNLAVMRAVNGDEDLLVTTDKGIVIRVHLNQVSISGRNTQGVRIIKLDEGHSVSSIAVVEAELEEENIENVENTETPVQEENKKEE